MNKVRSSFPHILSVNLGAMILICPIGTDKRFHVCEPSSKTSGQQIHFLSHLIFVQTAQVKLL